jgi:hypothetical protein
VDWLLRSKGRLEGTNNSWTFSSEFGQTAPPLPHPLVDSAGVLVRSDLDGRVVGIDPDTLRGIPRRIGMASGKSKHGAIRAALRGGWVNVLLTDTVTANSLLEHIGPRLIVRKR